MTSLGRIAALIALLGIGGCAEEAEGPTLEDFDEVPAAVDPQGNVVESDDAVGAPIEGVARAGTGSAWVGGIYFLCRWSGDRAYLYSSAPYSGSNRAHVFGPWGTHKNVGITAGVGWWGPGAYVGYPWSYTSPRLRVVINVNGRGSGLCFADP